jgi:hypothetical protein
VTPYIGVVVYVNNSLETRSRMPLTIFATAPGMEVSQRTLRYPVAELEITLYPPNSPPTLWIGAPQEGALLRSSMVVEGIIGDDLGSYLLSVRIDSAPSTEVEVDPEANGSFALPLSLLDAGSGRHRIEFRAFDGSKFSTASIRNVTVVNPVTTDSDLDGLTDLMEDRNGNGEVDGNETDAADPDTDDDGLPDGIEDRDGNGTTDPDETDPLNPDSDGDYLLDGVEDSDRNGRRGQNETSPLDPDSDGDGALDGDDFSPLDPAVSRGARVGQDDTTFLVLATVVFILLIVLVYLLYVRLAIGSGGS